MFVALTVLCCLLALALSVTGVAKLAGHATTVESLATVGFPPKYAAVLASTELAGSAGLLFGLRWWLIGVAAAGGVVLYFLGAVGAHIRSRNGNVAPALFLLALGVGALILRFVTR
ncbi:DoxX family protein [Mycolicibacterium sp. 120266]|uniref:DoxX family protein n=1 Tax=Mycolicibacterium sp. 120266 TaxID=3090601 RepID=UPI00299E82D7|nr:DoxX family protein [Mycolicibacterium sp. 120266]MDX1872085.1 DoxX family protein [Mycolicibacterium sp. 120266]